MLRREDRRSDKSRATGNRAGDAQVQPQNRGDALNSGAQTRPEQLVDTADRTTRGHRGQDSDAQVQPQNRSDALNSGAHTRPEPPVDTVDRTTLAMCEAMYFAAVIFNHRPEEVRERGPFIDNLPSEPHHSTLVSMGFPQVENKRVSIIERYAYGNHSLRRKRQQIPLIRIKPPVRRRKIVPVPSLKKRITAEQVNRLEESLPTVRVK